MKHNDEYYKDNYELIFAEIDAREKAALYLSEYLSNLGIDLNKEFHYEGQPVSDIIGFLNKRIITEKDNYDKAFSKNINGYTMDVNLYFSELFPNHKFENEEALLQEYKSQKKIRTCPKFK